MKIMREYYGSGPKAASIHLIPTRKPLGRIRPTLTIRTASLIMRSRQYMKITPAFSGLARSMVYMPLTVKKTTSFDTGTSSMSRKASVMIQSSRSMKTGNNDSGLGQVWVCPDLTGMLIVFSRIAIILPIPTA